MVPDCGYVAEVPVTQLAGMGVMSELAQYHLYCVGIFLLGGLVTGAPPVLTLKPGCGTSAGATPRLKDWDEPLHNSEPAVGDTIVAGGAYVAPDPAFIFARQVTLMGAFAPPLGP